MAEPAHPEPLALGLDAGGTQTRWALVRPGGQSVAEGAVAGFSATQRATAAGQQALEATLGALARAVQPHGHVQAVHGGITGHGGSPGADDPLAAQLADALGVPAPAVQLCSDIALVCAACFAPGQGIVVCAGTGSIGAHVDGSGVLHRAGGRGALIDDAGSGHWIACEALRQVWRAEDAAPGAWAGSAMARALLQRVGGTDWAHTRAFMARADRGEIGRLALAVAESAAAPSPDPAALVLLQRAGVELARLAQCLLQRLGPQPVALAGRVFELHPAVGEALAATLPGVPLQRVAGDGLALAAARLAARRLGPQPSSPEPQEPPCC